MGRLVGLDVGALVGLAVVGRLVGCNVGILVGLVILAQMAIILGPENFGLEQFASPHGQPDGYSNTKELGRILYTVYVYPFEIASVILVVAIIAAIALTLRKRPEVKSQDVAQQVRVRRNDRVRMVKMAAEKKDEVQS